MDTKGSQPSSVFPLASVITHSSIVCSYMRYAFPHDELKPLSASYTDSLVELGNAQRKAGDT